MISATFPRPRITAESQAEARIVMRSIIETIAADLPPSEQRHRIAEFKRLVDVERAADPVFAAEFDQQIDLALTTLSEVAVQHDAKPEIRP